jgi:dipeptidyl aminopeptidase/acylaminoacyl peptidase
MYLLVVCVLGAITVISNCVTVYAAAWQSDALAFRYAQNSAESPSPSEPACGVIAFASRPNGIDHIYTMNANGSDVIQVSSGTGEVDPRWSPDGTRIAFASEAGGIYVVNADGTNQSRLSPAWAADAIPDWSPDGTKIIFAEAIPSASPPASYIYTMSSIDGSNRTALIGNGANLFWSPHYNPRGTAIVFVSDLNQSSGDFAVYTMLPSGSGLKRLTNIIGVAADPAWSPDGSQIAVSLAIAGTGGNVNVGVMNADGSNLTQVTNFVEPIEGADPDWSPAGGLVWEWDNGGYGQSSVTAPAAVWTSTAAGDNARTTGQSCSDVGCHPTFQPVKCEAPTYTELPRRVGGRTQLSSSAAGFCSRLSPDSTMLVFNRIDAVPSADRIVNDGDNGDEILLRSNRPTIHCNGRRFY